MNPTRYIRIAAGLLLIYGSISLVSRAIGIFQMIYPSQYSQMNAVFSSDLSVGWMIVVSLIYSSPHFIISWGLLKLKKWAYYLSFLYIIPIILVAQVLYEELVYNVVDFRQSYFETILLLLFLSFLLVNKKAFFPDQISTIQ